ncbi:MAG TPA: hypothetical protein RMH85_23345 [Polyangiaceae bacterium LLY-WYZ-15_(1-7)]|nr:hypothetical protein [Myxococcales bacterium]MBJ72337.1 hypothetical protein [Sandaracinus sp.]HJK93835.1 hypothetical protein [Polyangiaceae bacterium LLY-WYZ-15_(1-7)]HJK99904.1 hypothetical protein [Polyangiaceae bacterium LLY-WYZ-15_(1-7)]HJL11430.1 hypothetical protein [Polyangiaceae bacterium LLY-WYZ-15_(1-7)]
MSRSIPALVALLLVLPAASSDAQPPGVEEPEDPHALADLVGIWGAEGRDMQVKLAFELGIENGALAGELFLENVYSTGWPFDEARLEGDRITLVVDLDDGEGPGSLVLQRTRRGLRLVRSTLAYPSVRGRPTLTRRDELWRMMYAELRDMAHDGDGVDGGSVRAYVAAVDAVREGVRAGGRPDALNDRDQVLCLLPSARDVAPPPRLRARAHARAQAAGRGSLCEVDVDTMTPGEAGPTASGCARATIADDDGETTLRARPSSRSEARGTLANGTTHRVDDNRGPWLFLAARRAWVFASNVECHP